MKIVKDENYPRIFPLVRHGDDIAVVEMRPLVVPSLKA